MTTEAHAGTAKPTKAQRPALPPMALSEASVHGDHPVIRLPFSVVINGRALQGNGISIVGAEATGLIDPQLNGKVQVAALAFNFPGYSISLPVEAAISAGAAEAGTVTLRFLEPTGPHLPQLRYILNSYVGGDLTGVDGLIRITDKVEKARQEAPSSKPSPTRRLMTGIRWGAFAGLGLLLVGFVGVKLYERLFVTPVTGLSTITLDGMDLRAISPGQLDFVNPAATQGEIAFAIRTTAGEVLAVSMPCDCIVAPGAAQSGATVLAGDTVMTVAPRDAQSVITSHVDGNGLRKLASGAHAEVHLPDGSVTNASLDPAELPGLLRSATADGLSIPVTLVPATPLEPSLLGAPVEVLITSDPLAAVGRFFSFK
jgi:alginate biosynthesis protein Alg44